MLGQGKGKIINISSVRGFQGRIGDLAYSPSKGGVNRLTKSPAIEWGPIGVPMLAFLFLVSLTASGIGAVCGIGGGIIIKPILDFLQVADAVTASFLASGTVLAMTVYTVGMQFFHREGSIDLKKGMPLGWGAMAGGILGHAALLGVKDSLGGDDVAGAAQACGIMVMTLAALLYLSRKVMIRSLDVVGIMLCMALCLLLGSISSFFGIGGGPINLVFLFYFFSMDTKNAVNNSLYVIFFSQATNLLYSLAMRTIPAFESPHLISMALGGIFGGIVGRVLHRRLTNKAIEKLFAVLMIAIIFLCFYNFGRFALA